MRTKIIAQYICVAFVAIGVGLNIKNAINDYGIGNNVHSLVAGEEYVSYGSESCFDGTLSFGTCTVSNAVSITQTIIRCGTAAGKWLLKGFKYCASGGTFMIIWEGWEQVTYQEYVPHKKRNVTKDSNGSDIIRLYTQYICTEKHGISSSNCNPVGTFYTVEGWEE